MKIKIITEKDLIKNRKPIIDFINKNPDKSLLFCANPILALEDTGYSVSTKMKSHIKSNFKFPFVRPQIYKKIKNGNIKFPWIKRVYFLSERKR